MTQLSEFRKLRNSKSEIRNSKQIRISNTQMIKTRFITPILFSIRLPESFPENEKVY
jgi:hypothetical protein